VINKSVVKLNNSVCVVAVTIEATLTDI
jgi:hypothetical protein